MKNKANKIANLTLVFGVLFLTNYFLRNYWIEKLWILFALLLVLFGLAFMIYFFSAIFRKNKRGILIGVLVIGTVFLTELYNVDKNKNNAILKATLMDDLSAIHLTLNDDSTFEVIASTILNEITFKGNYQLIDNKIIFKDRPYDNEFIPDTLYIQGDKIVFQFDKDGKAITNFASYFKIHQNELDSAQRLEMKTHDNKENK